MEEESSLRQGYACRLDTAAETVQEKAIWRNPAILTIVQVSINIHINDYIKTKYNRIKFAYIKVEYNRMEIWHANLASENSC